MLPRNIVSNDMYGIQLSLLDHVSEEQYQAISTLIYETDPFIYPALFECNIPSKDAALRIIPLLFECGNDAMFCKDNLFLFFNEDKVVGLILWYKGSINWNAELFYDVAQKNGVQLIEKNILAVSSGYVNLENDEEKLIDSQKIYLMNVCVDSKLRGLGIGKKMLDAFFREHPATTMELEALVDNNRAVKLYEHLGFCIIEEKSGFALNESKPRCFVMRRKGDKIGEWWK